jgi:hypothetical protein
LLIDGERGEEGQVNGDSIEDVEGVGKAEEGNGEMHRCGVDWMASLGEDCQL